jgi:energy-coupling factor transporter ATP-binding protein EcfA2
MNTPPRSTRKPPPFVLELTDRIVTENKLTALMVTHSMRQALDHGHRTVMLHQGRVVLDVSGDPAAAWTCPICWPCSSRPAVKSWTTTHCCWAKSSPFTPVDAHRPA